MKKGLVNRLQRVSSQIAAIPVNSELEQRALDLFRESGELSEHQRLAEAVINRVLHPELEVRGSVVVVNQAIRASNRTVANGKGDDEPPVIPPRDLLFREALDECEFVRVGARHAIKAVVSMGGDVTDPQFILEGVPIPDFGTVGWHLLGFPECLVEPPNEQRACHVLDRLDALRQRIDQDDSQWFEGVAEACDRFRQRGELPEDGLMREAVLVIAEFVDLLELYVAGARS